MPQAYTRTERAALPAAPRTWWGAVQIHPLDTHPERDGEHEKCGSRIPALEQTTVAIQALDHLVEERRSVVSESPERRRFENLNFSSEVPAQ